MTRTASETDVTADLHYYLREAREALRWKLDGLSGYDARRALTPTGTNLLGLVKHLTVVELLYFGIVFDRPVDDPPPWLRKDAAPNEGMWATADESREYIMGAYRRAWAYTDAALEELGPDSVGYVPW